MFMAGRSFPAGTRSVCDALPARSMISIILLVSYIFLSTFNPLHVPQGVDKRQTTHFQHHPTPPTPSYNYIEYLMSVILNPRPVQFCFGHTNTD